MKQFAIFSLALLYVTLSFAQVAPDKYWVKFTDKNNSPYSIDNPEAFLSQKAIDRRAKHGISIIENDLPVNPQYLESVESIGVTVLNPSKWFNSVTIFTTDPEALNSIEALPFVESVNKSNGFQNLNDTEKPFFANEFYSSIHRGVPQKSINAGNSYDYGAAANQIQMLNGDVLHDMGFDGEGMTIAVQDAGFLAADELSVFDSLWSNGQILGWKDFVNPQNPDIFNSHTHGSSVLSTMGANSPGEMVGTAPKADYWLLRSEDGGTEYLIEELNWVSAAEFADSVGADIINSSLGYTVFDDPSMDHSYEDMDGNTTIITRGADIAVSKGMIVVNSAGNEGNGSWQYIGAPADGDSVFSIGAVDGDGNYASFSSHGPTFDGRLKPNVVAQGQGTAVVNPYGGDIWFGSGTSFSSPITAGMVACLWQANPMKRNTEIMEAIEQSASLANEPDNYLGHGIPDYVLAHTILTVVENELEEEIQINTFPVPFEDELYIEVPFENIDGVFIELVDITGKSVYSKPEKLSSGLTCLKGLGILDSGFYILKVQAGNQYSTSKVLKK